MIEGLDYSLFLRSLILFFGAKYSKKSLALFNRTISFVSVNSYSASVRILAVFQNEDNMNVKKMVKSKEE